MFDSEKIFDQAEEIFFELAHENFSEKTFDILQSNSDSLELEIREGFDESWLELIYEMPEQEGFVEIEFSLFFKSTRQRLALMLLALPSQGEDDVFEKECHIQWSEFQFNQA